VCLQFKESKLTGDTVELDTARMYCGLQLVLLIVVFPTFFKIGTWIFVGGDTEKVLGKIMKVLCTFDANNSLVTNARPFLG